MFPHVNIEVNTRVCILLNYFFPLFEIYSPPSEVGYVALSGNILRVLLSELAEINELMWKSLKKDVSFAFMSNFSFSP